MDFNRKKLRLGDVLVNSGVITAEQLQKGLELQKGSGRKLGETLVDEGITTEENIAKALSSQLGYEMVDLQDISIDEEILNLVPPNILKKHTMIPFEYSRTGMNVLRVAMSDAMDDINIITNLQVEPVVATPRDVMLALDRYYGQAEVNSALEEYVKEKTSQMAEQEDIYSDDINNSPIVQLVKTMIEQAVRQRASDIHIEPMEKQVRVRYRIDGALYEKASAFYRHWLHVSRSLAAWIFQRSVSRRTAGSRRWWTGANLISVYPFCLRYMARRSLCDLRPRTPYRGKRANWA